MRIFTKDQIEIFPQRLKGIVEEKITLNKPGRVNLKDSYWPARLVQADSKVTLIPGQFVSIIGREGLTLLIVYHHQILL